MAILNFRLLIEYDGSAYNGWQSQRNGRTVQDELEAAFQQITGGKRVPVSGAGRTDAGVHARGQVANVKLETNLTPGRLQAAVNSHLAEDVHVQAVMPAADDFHARFSAVRRRYSYSLT
ncbi:MAG: tRNA pseudouridine(38-40) synthase TruA, partial [Candidatus Neomarinimicrobiota bacterium]